MAEATIRTRPLMERVWVSLPTLDAKQRVKVLDDAARSQLADYSSLQTKGESINDAQVIDYLMQPGREFVSSAKWVPETHANNVFSLVCNDRAKTNADGEVQKNVPMAVLGYTFLSDLVAPADLDMILENGYIEHKAPVSDFRQPDVPLFKAITQPKKMNGTRVQTDMGSDAVTDSGKEFYGFTDGGIVWLDRPMFVAKESAGMLTIKGMGEKTLVASSLKLQLRLFVVRGIKGS